MAPSKQINQPRRRNRIVDDDEWIRSFLHRAPVGTLATVNDGQPFSHPNLFVYDEERNAIYFHTARQGRTRSNVEGTEKASFSIFEMGRLLPAEKIIDYSTEYASVMIFGNVKIVEEAAEARGALEAQIRKYFPHKRAGRDFDPFTDEDMARTTVYRLDIVQWSAKRNQQETDFAGAFFYGSIPAQ